MARNSHLKVKESALYMSWHIDWKKLIKGGRILELSYFLAKRGFILPIRLYLYALPLVLKIILADPLRVVSSSVTYVCQSVYVLCVHSQLNY